MTYEKLRYRSGKSRGSTRPLQRIETIARDDDRLDESLIDTFPAGDPPAWIPIARVGAPERTPFTGLKRKLKLTKRQRFSWT
jgi:hypothetical protein